MGDRGGLVADPRPAVYKPLRLRNPGPIHQGGTPPLVVSNRIPDLFPVHRGSFQPNAVGTARRFHGCAPDDEPGERLSSGREEKRDPVRDHLGPLVLFDE